jgi:hypothetical protein
VSVPTRAELHAEVDRQLRDRYPDAPERLDPDDPSQSELVAAWLELRDDIVNVWTNDVFFRHFPEARKLNPDDPGDALLIEYWLDIRDLIRDDTPSRYNWQGDSPPADAQAPPPRLVDIHNLGGGGRFVLDFETDPGVDAAAAYVFPNGTPPGVVFSVYGHHQVLIAHVTVESLSSMPDWLEQAFTQATAVVEDVQPQRDPAAPAPPANQGKPHPEIDIDTPEELHSWLERAAHGAHELGDVAHIAELLAAAAENIAYTRAVAAVGVDATEGVAFGGAGVAEVAQYGRVAAIAEVLGVVAEVLSALGDIALVIWVGYQVIEAFKAEKEDEKRFGYIYGVMWEALGEADHIRVYSAPGITYSEAELQEAFVEGVAEGRAKGRELAIKNGIKLWVASVAVESGLGEWAAAHQVITDIYDRATGRNSKYQLEWPAPMEFSGFFP